MMKLELIAGVFVSTEWGEVPGHVVCRCRSDRVGRRPRTGVEVYAWQLDDAARPLQRHIPAG